MRWACEGKKDENMTSNQSSGVVIDRFFGFGVCDRNTLGATSTCTGSACDVGKYGRMSLGIVMYLPAANAFN